MDIDRVMLYSRGLQSWNYGPSDSKSVTLATAERMTDPSIRVCFGGDPPTCCAEFQLYGESAAVNGLYSEGWGMKEYMNLRRLLRSVKEDLRECGVRWVYALVHNDNPNRERLIRFYTKSIGLKPEAVRLRAGVEACHV